ncbi:MAG: hypothetical protein WBF03_01645 [Xanthobacteraceae bacterium]
MKRDPERGPANGKTHRPKHVHAAPTNPVILPPYARRRQGRFFQSSRELLAIAMVAARLPEAEDLAATSAPQPH